MKKTLALLVATFLTLSAASALGGESIVIGATATPHAEVLEFIKDDLAALGYDLVIQIFTEYPLPNPATAAGDLDANYFQHLPYLKLYNEAVPVSEQLLAEIPVHYEPFGLYGGTRKSLEEIEDGDTITITNDPSNETRALFLLASAGLITLPEGATVYDSLTVLDVGNPHNYELLEVNAELVPSTLDDAAYAVINGNYAIGAGLKPVKDALFLEPAEGEAGVTYTNYVVIRPEDKDSPWVEALRNVLHTDKVRAFIEDSETYAGGVIPVF